MLHSTLTIVGAYQPFPRSSIIEPCAQAYCTSHHLRNPPPSSSLPHVSPNPLDLLILQFPANFQQCLEGLRKTHKERSSCPSTCRPARGLQLSHRHSRRHSSASPAIPSVAGRRRKPHKMARPNHESLVLVIGNSWRGC
jgi:hypothetical protein